MDIVFLNGPIQNGPFTFQSAPGKAVGLLIAQALNDLLGNPPVRHLWNCTILANDLRHRAEQHRSGRKEFEAREIARKYRGSVWERTAVETCTDADPAVRVLALDLVAQRLSTGDLEVSTETVHVCARCGHMIGVVIPRVCAACTGDRFRTERQRHLIASRVLGRPVLDTQDLYGTKKTKHLRAIAAAAPKRLLLSRTRSHGIGLDQIGLPGLVLDPRTAVHITALAEARRLNAERAVITATSKAITNIAAHGIPFKDYGGTRLLYGRHSKVPGRSTDLSGVDPADRRRILFRRWFLPLATVGRSNDIRVDQLRVLYAHFRRAYSYTRPSALNGNSAIQEAIRSGNANWFMDKHMLSLAIRQVHMAILSH